MPQTGLETSPRNRIAPEKGTQVLNFGTNLPAQSPEMPGSRGPERARQPLLGQ